VSRSSGLGVRKSKRSPGSWCAAASLALLGCGAARESARARGSPSIEAVGAIRLGTIGLHAADDPTVTGARLLPERLEGSTAWGTEPGGGVRKLTGGVRLIARPDGTLLAGTDLLPGGPWSEVEVPERLGGGMLFAAGSKIWRAASWLGPLRLVAVGSAPIEQVLVGLDRVYLRFGPGTLAALDPRDGSPMALGPLPAAPWLASVSAQDAWHATAVADLRGALVTEDAGSTWRPAPRPAEPEARARGPRIPDRQSARTESARLDGVHALSLAVTDGWPLADGTALVARDGALTRVRLADGFIVEEQANAFPMNPARCHPFSLATPRDRGAFGYTCGEPHGATRIYVGSAHAPKLVEARRFAEPRQVDAFGNGALAVRGPCEEVGGAATQASSRWCAMAPNGQWSERIVQGVGAHLVILSDGQTVVLRSPIDGDLTTARIARTEGSLEIAQPISFSAMENDESLVLRTGVWMDGFEERRPGWIGGWVDLAGSVIGIEVSLGGQTRLGEYIRDARGPVVAGRWGLGWPPARHGFETTDGGMTWKKGIPLPDPLPALTADREHVCGPVGCLMEGWVRIGWGTEVPANVPEPVPLPRPRSLSASPLRLACEPATPAPPAAESRDHAGSPAHQGPSTDPVTRFPPLWNREGPAIPSGQVGLWGEPSSDFDPQLRTSPLARAYTWGPRDEEWDRAAQWELLWMWPWGTSPQVRASGAAPAPWPKLDAAQAAMRSLGGWQNGWTVVAGDDPDHALLVARGSPGTTSARVALLESGRAPVWVTSPSAWFESVGAAARLGDRWYVATSQKAPEPAATVLWSLEGTTAHELARLPRVDLEGRRQVRLARRSDGRALGIAVEGQPSIDADASLWVAGVDGDTGEVSDPSELAPLESADGALHVCGGDEPGWVLDLPYPGSVEIRIGEHWGANLSGTSARVRLSASQACVEGVVGSTDREAAVPPPVLSRAHGATPGALGVTPAGLGTRGAPRGGLDVVLYCAREYFHLRCTPQMSAGAELSQSFNRVRDPFNFAR
jgi:hypothetical protein